MPHVPDTHAEEMRRAFGEAGLRLTAQRRAVWRLFSRSRRGLSVVEAVGALKKKGVGLATVYRAVAALEKLAFLRRVHDRNRGHRFVAAAPGHVHHMVCRRCGAVAEFDACGMPVLERLLAAETGFAVEGHYLEVYGMCSGCRDK